MTYTYDGDGRRAKKSNGKLYWYGIGAEPLAESDLSGNVSEEYIFFGGERIARRVVSPSSVSYYFADHLGTSRVIVQANATTACYEADFTPYGKERVITNTCPQNYKFTGKERDTESNLDYFGARFYSWSFGRFHSPDLPFIDQKPGNPQSWNLYGYARNNPLIFIDPTGNEVGPAMDHLGLLPAVHHDLGEGISSSYVAGKTSEIPDVDLPSFVSLARGLWQWLQAKDPKGELGKQCICQQGHHLIPNRGELDQIGRHFANVINTGPLSNPFPNQPGFTGAHRAYNAAVETILQEAEQKFGIRNSWSISQWKEAARTILNSRLPAIRGFLEELNRNNGGRVIPALAAAIQNYRPSVGLIVQYLGSTLAARLSAPFIICVVCQAPPHLGFQGPPGT